MTGQSHPRPKGALRLAAAAVAFAALWLGAQALAHASPAALAALVLAVAWPIWLARTEAAQMDRRLLVEGTLERRSRLFRLLWPGHLVAAAEAVAAGLSALLLLGLASQLQGPHWVALGLGAAVLSLAAGPLERWLARIARPGMAGPLARRFPLFLVAVVGIGIGVFAVDYAVVGAPDTRGMAWEAVAAEAFATGLDAETTLAAWLIGGLAAADALSWHLSQILIPALPDGALRAASWALVLGAAGVLSWLFARFALGALVLAEGRGGGARLSPAPALAVGAVALGMGMAFEGGPDERPSPEAALAEIRAVAATLDPCGEAAPSPARLSARAAAEIAAAEAEIAVAEDRRIDALSARLAVDTRAGIEAYLDWHYSLSGEYARLAALAFGDLAETMRDKLAEAVPHGQRLADRIAAERRILDSIAEVRLASAATAAGAAAAETVAAAPCLGADLAALDLGALPALAERPIPEGALAVGATVALRGALSRVAGAAAGRLAARESLRAASRMAARTAAKRGGSALASAGGAAAACAPGGPLAIACGIGAGVIAWVSIDLIAIEIAEARGRDQMRAALAAALGGRNAQLVEHLRAHAAERRTALAAAHEARLARAFIPARDG